MVTLPPGSFTMGVPASEEEREHVPVKLRGASAPSHRVTIGAGIALGKYDVTRGEYAAFVRATSHGASDKCAVWHKDGDHWKVGELGGYSWRNPGFSQTDAHPVVCVSWNDVEAYVAWLSRKTGHHYRLPSEAEWEYAARAGSRTTRFWGDSRGEACAYANVADSNFAAALNTTGGFRCSDGYVYTSPIGTFRPNAFGFYDMLGNVWQWLGDCWNANYEGAPVDGSTWEKGTCKQRIVRGGSWDAPEDVRAGVRYGGPIENRGADNGFRVARTE